MRRGKRELTKEAHGRIQRSVIFEWKANSEKLKVVRDRCQRMGARRGGRLPEAKDKRIVVGIQTDYYYYCTLTSIRKFVIIGMQDSGSED